MPLRQEKKLIIHFFKQIISAYCVVTFSFIFYLHCNRERIRIAQARECVIQIICHKIIKTISIGSKITSSLLLEHLFAFIKKQMISHLLQDLFNAK